MKYTVLLTRQAKKNFRNITQRDQKRIKQALQEMAHEPFTGDVTKLTGYEAYRRRVGAYRIIFSVTEETILVIVFDILRRNEMTYRQ